MTRSIARALWSKWSMLTASTFTAVERREAEWGTHRSPQQQATETGRHEFTESKESSTQSPKSTPGTAKRRRDTTSEATVGEDTDKETEQGDRGKRKTTTAVPKRTRAAAPEQSTEPDQHEQHSQQAAPARTEHTDAITQKQPGPSNRQNQTSTSNTASRPPRQGRSTLTRWRQKQPCPSIRHNQPNTSKQHNLTNAKSRVSRPPGQKQSPQTQKQQRQPHRKTTIKRTNSRQKGNMTPTIQKAFRSQTTRDPTSNMREHRKSAKNWTESRGKLQSAKSAGLIANSDCNKERVHVPPGERTAVWQSRSTQTNKKSKETKPGSKPSTKPTKYSAHISRR